MNADEIIELLYSKSNKSKAKCSVCGKEIEIPNMYSEKKLSILSPYCCSTTVFIVQWLIHNGWHVRNLGVQDNHPYYCNDCWIDGTPEYKKADYGDAWCKQVENLMNNK